VSEPSLTIGQVASQVGLRTSALRYYEETGLLPSAERVAGKRRYGPEAVELLRLIRFCQAVGFSLAEVRQLLAPPTARRAKETWRQLVDAKLIQLSALIDQAQAIRGVLEASRDCDCVTLESCSFLQGEPTDATRLDRRTTFPRGPLGAVQTSRS
jgi:MerR family redox-sensitive transcriptional activator SoxR